jgi:prophage antirepressor-like protein
MEEKKGLTVFRFQDSHAVRTLERDGEPWFVAKDVCDVLGLENSRDALAKMLDDDERAVLKASDVSNVENHYVRNSDVSNVENPDGKNFKIPNRGLQIVNEPGLYRLIFQSRKPEAKAFKHWVCHEVLPSVRKTGACGLPGKGLPEYALLCKRLNKLEKEMPGHNGRVKAGPGLPVAATDLKSLLYAFLTVADEIITTLDTLSSRIGQCLAAENPSVTDIRFRHSHITGGTQKQIKA